MDAGQVAVVLFAVIGVASAVAAVLRSLLPYLRAFAKQTQSNADDGLVESLSMALDLLTMLVEALHRIANEMGLNPPVAVKTAEAAKPAEPEEKL